MKKLLLLVIIATVSTFILLSCGKEDGSLINPTGIKPTDPDPGGNNGSAKKCYVSEIKTTPEDPGDDETIVKFTYNSKNLIESREDNGEKTSFEYDANNRITKMIAPASATSDRSEALTYEYDSKGNMSKIKYVIKGVDMDGPYEVTINYILTTNAKGQVEKIKETSSDDDTYEYLLEYDGKNNITKIIIVEDGDKTTLVENAKFDDKSSIYLNANLSKAFLPLILIAADFGSNYTHFYNANNVLSDKVYSSFTEEIVPGVYDYGYTAEGFPSKMTLSRETPFGVQKEEQTFIYKCK